MKCRLCQKLLLYGVYGVCWPCVERLIDEEINRRQQENTDESTVS